MRKTILLLITLFSLIIPSAVFADTNSKEEIVDVGYYDIWRHSDGATWQKNIGPDSNVTATFSINFSPSKTVKSVSGQYLTTLKNQYTSDLKKSAVTKAEVKSCTYKDGKITYTVNCNLTPYQSPKDIKQGWQSKAVSGLRYYIPVIITVTYEDSGESLETLGGYSSMSSYEVGGYSCWFYDGYNEYSTYYSLSQSNGEQWSISDRYREYEDGRIVYLYKDGKQVN